VAEVYDCQVGVNWEEFGLNFVCPTIENAEVCANALDSLVSQLLNAKPMKKRLVMEK
jgi:hypothetical protein